MTCCIIRFLPAESASCTAGRAGVFCEPCPAGSVAAGGSGKPLCSKCPAGSWVTARQSECYSKSRHVICGLKLYLRPSHVRPQFLDSSHALSLSMCPATGQTAPCPSSLSARRTPSGQMTSLAWGRGCSRATLSAWWTPPAPSRSRGAWPWPARQTCRRRWAPRPPHACWAAARSTPPRTWACRRWRGWRAGTLAATTRAAGAARSGVC